jgi:hypothetical protein
MLLILVFLLAALGHRIFRLFHVSWDSWAEEFCFSFGLGSGAVIFLVIVLAALGGLYEFLVVLLLLASAALVYRDLKILAVRGIQGFLNFVSPERPAEEKILACLLGAGALLTLLASATPPFFHDALVHHLAVPQQYLIHHGFFYLPYHQFSNFPASLHMLFLVALSFSGGMLAALLSWVYAPLTALAAYAFAKPRWGGQVAVASAAILLLVPGVLILSTLTALDLAVMFYSFLSFYALLAWFRSNRNRSLLLAGIFCGLAVGTKYTAIVTTFLGALLVLIVRAPAREEKRSPAASLKHCILLGLIVLACISPWLIKNGIYTGNPVYPFLQSVFGQGVAQSQPYGAVMQRIGNPIHSYLNSLFAEGKAAWTRSLKGILLILKSPWTVTMTTNGAAGKTGVLFLLCLPCLIFLKKADSTVRILLLLAGWIFFSWVLLLPWMLRFAFPMLPPLALATGYLLFSRKPACCARRKWITAALALVLAWHLCLFLVETTSILRPFGYLFGNQSREAFLLDHNVNYYPAALLINSKLPSDSKILFVGELRGYYCERECVLQVDIEAVDKERIILRKLILDSGSAGEVVQKLREMGISHILVNQPEMECLAKSYLSQDSFFDFQNAKDNEILRSLFSPPWTRLLYSDFGVNLYEISVPPSCG